MATKIETLSGFECEIDEEALDDFRFLKLLRESEKDYTAVCDVVSFLLGEDEERFMEHLAVDGGRVPLARVKEELKAIFTALKSKKK